MDKKKFVMIAGGLAIVIVIILIIALIAPNLQPSTPGTNSVVSSIVIAKGEDANKNPIGATTIFSINDPEIHAVVTFRNLPINQNITYQWFDSTNNTVLKEEARQNTTVFSGLSSSNLTKDEKLSWGMGNYEFKVFINGALIAKEPYSVKTDADIEKDKVLSSIQSIQLTTAVDVLGNPTKNVGTVFSKNDDNIFASVSYQGMPVRSEFEGRWIYLDEDRLIKKYQKSIIGSNIFAFSMNAKTDSWLPIKKWPVGRYVLKIYLNGDQIREILFTVE